MPPQHCVSNSYTAVALGLQTAAMMACILDTSKPRPSRKPCWLSGQVWLRCKIPTDMVRLGMGLRLCFIFLFIAPPWCGACGFRVVMTHTTLVQRPGLIVADIWPLFECVSCLYLRCQNKEKCPKKSLESFSPVTDDLLYSQIWRLLSWRCDRKPLMFQTMGICVESIDVFNCFEDNL